MRVFVTGAAGFIGSHVTRALVAGGHEVTGLVLPGETTSRIADLEGRIPLREGDLGNASHMKRIIAEERPEATVHLAWYTVPGKYWTAPENLDCVAQGMRLARVLAEHGCRRIVAAGTCAEYDWSHEHFREDETPCRPRTLYGAAKHALHLVLERFCELRSVELAWLRYNFIYGPGEHPGRLVPSVIEKLSAGQDVPCTDGRQTRDFLYVEDAAAATVAVLGSDVGGAINIGSGQPTTVREVVETLARLIGGPGRPVFGARQANPNEPLALIPDLTRLNAEVGWRPSRSLEEGLERTVDHWRASRASEAQTQHGGGHAHRH